MTTKLLKKLITFRLANKYIRDMDRIAKDRFDGNRSAFLRFAISYFKNKKN